MWTRTTSGVCPDSRVITVRTVLVAPDSFKGSLRASEAARAIGLGVVDRLPGARVIYHPVSDGGEGMVEVLAETLSGKMIRTEVSGPLPGTRVSAQWCLSGDGRVAVIEMAQAAGLPLIPPHLRDPRLSTTRGVGELLRTALDKGVASVVMGIGGSATNDGGAGMAEALGAELLDEQGKRLGPGGACLARLKSIDCKRMDDRVQATEIIVACDVQNPLFGPTGASAVYGPQKGATAEDVRVLDEALRHYRDVLQQTFGLDVQELPGSGAAGGLGAGLVAFCRARLMRGIDVVLDATGFDKHLVEADLVITGEGRLDRQFRYGKALSGVVERTHRLNKPVVAVVGGMEGTGEDYTGSGGFLDVTTLVNDTTSQDLAMQNGSELLRIRTREILDRVVRY